MKIRCAQIVLMVICILVHFLPATITDNLYQKTNQSVPFLNEFNRTNSPTLALPGDFSEIFFPSPNNFSTAHNFPHSYTFLAKTVFIPLPPGNTAMDQENRPIHPPHNSHEANPDAQILTGFKIIIGTPNLFHSTILFRFTLRKPDRVQILVYNRSGEMVRQLTDAVFPAGSSFVEWNTVDDSRQPLPNDIYLVVIQTNHYRIIRRIPFFH